MGDFKNDILAQHNKYRKDHSTPALKWSSALEKNARKWAEQLAKKGYIQHANQTEEGENIACLRGAELTGAKATDMWYEEISDYNFNKPGFSSETGHFTQVVWKSSSEIGVGKATASNGMQFVVARYLPPGNMLRRFPENVLPSGKKTSPGGKENSNSNNSNNNNNSSTGNGGNGGNGGTRQNNRNIKPKNPDAKSAQSEKDFCMSILRSHNQYRKRNGAPALKWSAKLAKSALEAAEEASRTNTLRSVEMANVGQNMAAMTGGELTGDRVTKMWYDEEEKYDYDNPGFNSSTGSFTQLVWRSTTEIGVGRAFGPKGQTFVIALYSAPGNIRGQYEENVHRPSGSTPLQEGKEEQGCQCVIL